MFKLPQKIKDDGKKYKDNLEKFLKGQINDSYFRGIRVPWGSYSQRGGKVLMSRLRIPAGILTPLQLKAIATAAKKYGNGNLHFTTRQDIQIHNVSYENSFKIVEYLEKYDISPRGGGGNSVRNVTSCYLSGICEKEQTEVYKIVWGLSEYLLSLEETNNLPRKFKIAFSGCEKDCSHTGVNDLGFVALPDGFKVLCGGGMGAKSAVGRVLESNINEEDIPYVTKAVLNVFNKYGDRKNKNHNRLRFLISDLGYDKFYELYVEELKKVKNTEHIVFRSEPAEVHSQDPSLKYLHLRIPSGEISADSLVKLTEIAGVLPDIHFRTTPRQNLIIANIPVDRIAQLEEMAKNILGDYSNAETALDIISCKAATTCNLGICNAIALAPEIVSKLQKMNFDFKKMKDFNINLSGCSNSCGQHPIGTLSFSGVAKKVYNRTVPFYKVYFGGSVDAENTKLALEIGVVPAKAVPDLVSEFLNDFTSREYLEKLIKKYSYVPPYEDDKSFYVDFGKTDEFSLDGLSQGECGAGVIDMIESDLESAKKSLEKELWSEAAVYCARALLIAAGVDPKDEKEAIHYFIEKFVYTGIADPFYAELEKKYPAGITPEFAKKLFDEIKWLYQLMDSSFNFPKREIKSVKNEISARVSYDLRGTPCPINYIKAKLKLEDMSIGEILEIYLDEGEPIANVPKSLLNDGQEVEIFSEENYFRVIVKKKV